MVSKSQRLGPIFLDAYLQRLWPRADLVQSYRSTSNVDSLLLLVGRTMFKGRHCTQHRGRSSRGTFLLSSSLVLSLGDTDTMLASLLQFARICWNAHWKNVVKNPAAAQATEHSAALCIHRDQQGRHSCDTMS